MKKNKAEREQELTRLVYSNMMPYIFYFFFLYILTCVSISLSYALFFFSFFFNTKNKKKTHKPIWYAKKQITQCSQIRPNTREPHEPLNLDGIRLQ
jgi:hypothetical protein